MTATGWTDDVEDLPLQYSFAYQPRTSAGEGGVDADAPPSMIVTAIDSNNAVRALRWKIVAMAAVFCFVV